MLRVENRFMIKDLYRKGVNITEIARQTGHDRKTIRAILKGPGRVSGTSKAARAEPEPTKP